MRQEADDRSRGGKESPSVVVAEDYHRPVLLQEAVEALAIRPDGIYVDVTFGGGGHSREILHRLGPGGHLFAFDWDADAHLHSDLASDRFTLIRSDFRYLPHFLDYYGVEEVDGILADLGVSSHHFDDEGRGFSFRHDTPIDMRMNRSGARTALDLIQESEAEELAGVLRQYGEVRQAYRMAIALKEASSAGELATTGDLVRVLSGCGLRESDKKTLAQVFQALRIAVNDELGALSTLLEAAPECLAEEGRLVVITYHSLEDRLVKNFMRVGNVGGERHTDVYGVPLAPLEPLHSKPIVPTSEEVQQNPRSRSAKLRIARKKKGGRYE